MVPDSFTELSEKNEQAYASASASACAYAYASLWASLFY